MPVQKREIFAPSAVETPTGDLGAEAQHVNQPKSTGANGDTTAHGDLAGYRAKQAQYGKEQNTQGAAGFTVGGE